MSGLSEAKQLAVGQLSTFAAKVLRKGPTETYQYQGQQREFFTLLVADASDSAELRVYNKRLNVREGRSYKFTNLIRKHGLASFWLVSSSTAPLVGRVVVPVEMEEKCLAEESAPDTADELRSLKDAAKSSSTSTVQAKVIQVSYYYR